MSFILPRFFSSKSVVIHLWGEFSPLELHIDSVFNPPKKTNLIQLESTLFPFTKNGCSDLDHWFFFTGFQMTSRWL